MYNDFLLQHFNIIFYVKQIQVCLSVCVLAVCVSVSLRERKKERGGGKEWRVLLPIIYHSSTITFDWSQGGSLFFFSFSSNNCLPLLKGKSLLPAL